jgi:hypothetical protein
VKLRSASFVFAGVLVLVGCGKQGGSSQVSGVYRLIDTDRAATLLLESDGTYVVHREAPPSIASLDCGRWKTEAAGSAHVVHREGAYWPTPDRYPSARVEKIALAEHDDTLVVTGESEWAGTFTQRWERVRGVKIMALPECVRAD